MTPNLHPASVHALFDAMPLPLLTFGVNGTVTYANTAAKQHPGRPAQVMGSNPAIQKFIAAVTQKKINLPYPAKLELADGHLFNGKFMTGPAGSDVAFLAEAKAEGPVAAPSADFSAGPKYLELKDIMELLRVEISPPLMRLANMLGDVPQSPEGTRIEEAADALNQRLRRLTDLVAVFGDDIVTAHDRIELLPLVRAVCDELAPRALAMKMSFEVSEPEQTLPPIYGNAKLIRRAFYECFDNALTHSRKEVNRQQGLSVKIDHHLTGEHVLISVRNQGAIPDEFKGIETREPFAKLAKTAPAQSSGRLGLPLVQRIVGLHGGKMQMKMVDEDEVKVLLEFPTGAPVLGQAQLDMAQTQRYAKDLAQLMSRRKKEK